METSEEEYQVVFDIESGRLEKILDSTGRDILPVFKAVAQFIVKYEGLYPSEMMEWPYEH